MKSQTPPPPTKGQTIPWASFYDTLVGIMSLGKSKQLRNEIAAKAPYKSGDKVLDVGCGTGDQALLASEVVGIEGAVFGSDASPQMINIARSKVEKSQLDVDFQVDLIENISHSDESFDVVMNSLVMHHLPGDLKKKGINEFHRILKPGGSVYIVDMESVAGNFFQRLSDFVIHLHGGNKKLRDNVQQLIPLLKDSGFSDISTGRVNRQLAYICGKK
ncbi:MAG: class I SAM-dependent methyltransferase [Candidatus Marinimicrobia bacterium]|mgnify:FL=1|jgi:demethylmenaquinone methyltransferase/2-methoxy-6-polyprenyl-1,4-benzoquinol methylase/phosphoethanolamine N-methyltransferase|nr:class I SAM-dependent methyltransferase [Candidatus Neomarinimicrobiota bacterium]MBT3576361.1 class I SAM-dependent methyltransferase [Candidatus Neomarinimicrobiota bacterium]MBT3680059.1 class I SAM-dependent methyltransferase [Candidatus Neomarinimicrobiota bacterium]MBT3950044.1 class I SAM-dependent methyltransferase [Candidatus Neomarinimicrobiota bacterium]MBT4253990.1 class I SAM-dependent methyltransferase [Candidatus Neomarinimicrobiota bacterium]